jgi:hypothetical protein
VNGSKYLAGTAVFMVAVLIGFIVVLEQFNVMVYPSRITAFNINTGEKGVCQIEFLGEKVQLAVPDLELLSSWGVQNQQALTQNTFQALQNESMAVRQTWDTSLKDLLQESKFEQLLNTFETYGSISLKEWLQKSIKGVWN